MKVMTALSDCGINVLTVKAITFKMINSLLTFFHLSYFHFTDHYNNKDNETK